MGVIVVALVIGIPWGWSAIQEANWDAHSGTSPVEVSGALWGDGYEVVETGTLETWAEHSETALYVDVTRTDDNSGRTPVLLAVFDHNGGQVRCETARGYIWSTSTGSQLTLLCDRYISLENLADIKRVLVQP